MANEHYRWLTQQAKPARRYLFLSIFLGIFSGLLIIAQSAALAYMIDQVYLHAATRAALADFLFSFLGLVFLRMMTTYLREIVSTRTAQIIKHTVRDAILNPLASSSPVYLSQFKTASLASTLIEQVEALHGFFSDYFPQMMIVIILPVIILITVFLQNWVAGAILLVTAPLIPLFMALIGMRTAKLNQENFQILSRMSAHFLDRLQGLATLSLFNRAHAETEKIGAISEAFRDKTMRILRIAFLSTATLELFSTLAIAIIAVYLGLGLLGFVHVGFDGFHITLFHALFILLLAPEFFMPLRQLGTFYHARSEALGAANEIIELGKKFAKNASKMNKSEHDRLNRSSGGSLSVFSFRDIIFSYDANSIFKHFSLTLRANETIAITGGSGTGKSTLLNLLAKFIFPTSGNIFINNTDLNEIDSDDWRDQIAFLQQHTRLMPGTIADNILLAKPNATQDELMRALNQSGVNAFLPTLPHGLHTSVTEQNAGISGGQTQRIALARIILKDAPIVLLDEPTAHLDQTNVDIILHLLAEWHHQKTIVIATHDERVIALADHVVALQ